MHKIPCTANAPIDISNTGTFRFDSTRFDVYFLKVAAAATATNIVE